MSDKHIIELTAAIANLNKTLLMQQSSKASELDESKRGSRRKDSDVVRVKIEDAGSLEDLKGLLSSWYKQMSRSPKGASPSGLTEANRRLTMSSNNLNRSTGKLSEAFDDLTNSTGSVAASFSSLNRRSTEQARQQEKMIKGYQAMRKEFGNTIGSAVALRTTLGSIGPGTKSGGTPPGDGDGGNDTNNKFDSLKNAFVKAMADLGFKIGSFMTGVLGYISDSTLAMKTGSQYGYLSTPIDAAMMGLSSQEYLKLGIEYRNQAMRLTGGMNEWMGSLKRSQLDILAYTGGDMAVAAQLGATMRARLMDMGFGLNEITNIIGKGDTGYIGTLKRLTHATGKTVQELDQFVGNVLQSDNFRNGLFKLDKADRASYVTAQTDFIQRMFMVTGSLERANQIVNEANRQQQMKGLDRIRDAARLSVAARALGMSSSDANELNTLRQKRVERMSSTERERFADLLDTLSRSAEARIGSGNIGMEIFTQTMLQRLQQDQDSLRKFNRSLDQPTNENTLNRQIRDSMTTTFSSDGMTKVLSYLEILKKSLGSNLAAIIVGGFSAVIGLMAGKGLMGKFRSAANKPGGIFTRLGGSPNPVPAGQSTMSSIGKNILRGGAVGLAGYAATKIVDHNWTPMDAAGMYDKQRTMNVMNSTTIGLAIGTAIAPGIGTILGGTLGAMYGFYQNSTISEASLRRNRENELHARQVQLTNIEADLLMRRHHKEISTIDGFVATMTSAEREKFLSTIRNIESQHNVRITSIDQLHKYEDQHLREFVAQRTKMLRDRHAMEVSDIQQKRDNLQRGTSMINDRDNMIGIRSELGPDNKIVDWMNRISGKKLSSVIDTLQSDDRLKNSFEDAFLSLQQSDPSWSDADFGNLMTNIRDGKAMNKNSKEGRLAEKLFKQVRLIVDSEINKLDSSIEAWNNNSAINLFDGVSSDSKQQHFDTMIAPHLANVVDRLKQQGVDTSVDILTRQIHEHGKVLIPEANGLLFDAINRSAVTTTSARGFNLTHSGTAESTIRENKQSVIAKLDTEEFVLGVSAALKDVNSSTKNDVVVTTDPQLVNVMQQVSSKLSELVEVTTRKTRTDPTIVRVPSKPFIHQ